MNATIAIRQRMMQAAECCLGTPFHHQGRVAQRGLDCIGLVVHAARAAGIPVEDCLDYGRRPDGARLKAALAAHGFGAATEIEEGDVLLFRIAREPQHVAIAMGPETMIHSYMPVGRVVAAGLGETWRRRLAGIYRYQG